MTLHSSGMTAGIPVLWKSTATECSLANSIALLSRAPYSLVVDIARCALAITPTLFSLVNLKKLLIMSDRITLELFGVVPYCAEGLKCIGSCCLKYAVNLMSHETKYKSPSKSPPDI